MEGIKSSRSIRIYMCTILSFLVNFLFDTFSILQKRCKYIIKNFLYNLHQNHQSLLFCHIYFIIFSNTYNIFLNYLRVRYTQDDPLPLNSSM